MPVTAQEFWQLLVLSSLCDEAACRQYADTFAKAKEQGTVAKDASLPEWLIANGVLTRYQAKILLGGKPGPFIYGDYLVRDRIATGTFAGMFRAIHRPSGHNVCLQLLDSAAIGDAADALGRQAAVADAIALRTPHLTRCYAFVHGAEHGYFVLEDLAGQTLAEQLDAKAVFAPNEAMRIVWQINQGLLALHQAGHTHGAMRPSRVWHDSSGLVRLMAYPRARNPLELAGGGSVVAPRDAEEIDYLAPECAEAPFFTPGSDIYSLGCLFYRLLAGQSPYIARDDAHRLALHRSGTPRPLDQIVPTLSAELATLVMRMMSKKPEARFASAAQFAMALAPLYKQSAVAVAMPARSPTQAAFEQATSGTAVPMIATAAAPIVVGAASPSKRVAAQRGRKQRNVTPVWIAVAAAVLLIGGAAVAIVLSGSSESGSTVTPDKVVDAAVASPNEKSSTKTPRTTSPTPAKNQPSETQRGDTVLPLAGSDMWASPTHGTPIDLKYLAPGGAAIIALRPADLMKHAEGEKLFDARTSGWLGPWIVEQLTAATGAKLDEIDHAVFSLADGRDDTIHWSLVAQLHAAKPIDAQLKDWGDPKQVERDGKTWYERGDRAYYLPDADEGRTIVTGPTKSIVDDVIPRGEIAPPLSREMEMLIAATDQDRDVTILAAPQVLLARADQWLIDPAAKLQQPLDWFLTGQEATAGTPETGTPRSARELDLSGRGLPKAIALSLDLEGDNMFVELRVTTDLDKSPPVVAAAFADRVERLPRKVSDYVRNLELTDYSHDILWEFPRMVELIARFTHAGTDGRQVVLRGYLPSIAAHNLALGTRLTLIEQPRVAGAGGQTPAALPDATQPLADRLNRRMSLVFDRNTLEKALQLVGEEIGAEVVIVGADLETEGITKNQSFAFSERDQPAREILQKIMLKANPDGKLVYVIRTVDDTKAEALYVTTRGAAKKRGEALPRELAEQTEK